MTVHCKIELADYRRANWLHLRPRKFFKIAGVTLALLGVFGLAIALYEFIATGTNLQAPLVLGGVFAVAAYCIFISYPRRVTKLYQQQKLLHESFTVEVSESGLVSHHPNGNSDLPWSVFHKWKASNDMILLYQCDPLFHIFALRYFSSPAEFMAFQEILRSHLGPAMG